mmetsp:Transcript_15934/g.29161  ORF Transcript_15934/g.29161 Transcript_15934/m.29161 type:complete len:213 (-) Transcript_15934:347-985(-)
MKFSRGLVSLSSILQKGFLQYFRMRWLCFSTCSKKLSLMRRPLPDAPKTCSICKEVILSTVTTDCSHNFCELCFFRRVTQVNECPVCALPRPNFSRNTEMDKEIKACLSERDQKLLRQRKNQRNFARRIHAIEIGMNVDFQDKTGRWRRGTIKQIIAQKKSASLLWIRFEEMKGDNDVTVVDELIEQTSLRIAPLGFITREEGPALTLPVSC